MSKKHFDMMAAEIKAQVDVANGVGTERNLYRAEKLVQAQYAADTFARVAQRFNPKFQYHRFMEACGLSD